MNEIDKNLMILREKMKKGFENYEEYVPGWDEIVKPLNEKLSNINDLLEDCKVLEEMMMADQENFEEFENLFELKLKASQEVLKLDDKKEDLAKKEKTPQKEVKKIKEKEENYLVAPISQEEFNTIPKYMIGRFTLESLNEIAQKFDEFLKHKISIYSKAGKSLTRHEKQELDKFRELEEKARKRLSTNTFCVENDIRPLIQEKLKPLFSKSIPCLRHVRRIREERCGPLTFYYP